MQGLQFEGRYVELASDGAAVCARRQAGGVDCARSWSSREKPERQPAKVVATPLSGTFDRLWSGAGLCASRRGQTSCFSPADWYGPRDQQTPFGPGELVLDGDFVSVARGRFNACGVTRDGEMRCKSTGIPQTPPLRSTLRGTGFAKVAGFWALCGQRTDGSLECEEDVRGADAGLETFTVARVSSMSQFDREDSATRDPSEEYRAVGSSALLAFAGTKAEARGGFVEITSAFSVCGRRADDTVTCVTPAFYDDDVVRSAKEVRADSAANRAMRVDGRIIGYSGDFTRAADTLVMHGRRELGLESSARNADDALRAKLPRGHRLRDLQYGNDFACGIAPSGTLSCVGEIMGSRKLVRPPAGTFTSLALGGLSACALESKDGTLRCWGSDYFGQLTGAPQGRDFVSVTATYLNHCAQKRSGELVCWGRSFEGTFELPFVPSSYALTDHGVCAVEAARPGLRCWGLGYSWTDP